MDCTQAQQILSEAVDREPVATELLAEARAHCRTCPNCARFVRGLALMQRAQSPAPSSSLHDQVMTAVAAARAADASGAETDRDATTALTGDTAEMQSVEATQETPSPQVVELAAQRRRANPWAVGAWIGAAAALVIIAGFAAVSGLRSIMSPTSESTRGGSVLTQDSTADKNLGASPTEESAGTSSAEDAAAAPAAASQVAPNDITVNGVVYASAGTVTINSSQLTTAGTTTTSLDSAGSSRTYTVFATPTSGRVALLVGGETLAFDIVKRRLQGRDYVMTSQPISAFGVWPSLPAGFTQPTTAGGAPTFVLAETDDLGVQLYSRPGIPIESGFAVAPGTPASDPAGGNPNWTWWATPSP